MEMFLRFNSYYATKQKNKNKKTLVDLMSNASNIIYIMVL